MALTYATNLRNLFFATRLQKAATETQLILTRSASSSSGQRGGRGGGGRSGGGGGGRSGGGRSGGGGGGSFASSGSSSNNNHFKGNSSSSSSSSSTVGRSSSISNSDHHHHNSSSSLPKVTSPELQIVANEEIAKKVGGLDALVRVIVAEDKSNLGVISVADALSAAKSRGLDVVMIATPPGSPAVCRLISLASFKVERQEAAEKEREREREAKTAQEALAQEARKQKEIRLTTRTDDHDLGVKCSKIVEFLRSSHSVRVSVSFSKSTSAWVKEEPHRRAMFAAVVRAVMASGAGHIDPNSIQGSGANLVGVFSPNKVTSTSTSSTTTSTAPRGSSEWDKVLNKLSDPRGLRPDEGEVPSFVKSAMLPTASSAISSTTNISETSIAQTQASKISSALPPSLPSSSLSSSTLPVPPPTVKHPSLATVLLAPVEMLIRSSRRISSRSSSSSNASTLSAAPSPPADDEDRGISASGMGDVRFKIGGGKAGGGGGGGGSTSGIVVKGRRSALSGGGARGGGSNSGGGGGGRGKR